MDQECDFKKERGLISLECFSGDRRYASILRSVCNALGFYRTKMDKFNFVVLFLCGHFETIQYMYELRSFHE